MTRSSPSHLGTPNRCRPVFALYHANAQIAAIMIATRPPISPPIRPPIGTDGTLSVVVVLIVLLPARLVVCTRLFCDGADS